MTIPWLISKPEIRTDSYIQIEPLGGQTEKNVNAFIESFFKRELKGRVVREQKGFVFKVDNAFRISRIETDLARETALQWESQKTQSKWMMAVDGGLALSGSIVCCKSDRWGLILGACALTVGSLYFAGRELAFYEQADHELQVWIRPQFEFLQRRNKALASTLPEIFMHECRYGLNPKKGTLTDLEVLVLWKRQFKKFTDPLLASRLEDPNEQQLWLYAWITDNPLLSKFFKHDPKVLEAKGWERVKEFKEKTEALSRPLTYKDVRQVLQDARDVLIDGEII